ncbi:Pleckstrin homology domain-containing protein [Pilobolus umbonatus]|nr:Pleckstrin homology domain-containing protein [Pilobolus umbonatus]
MKEGVVMRKYLLESANHKAKHREWRECLLVVKNGELKMFGLPPDYNNDVSRRSILRVNASALNINESRINNLHNPHEPLSSVYTQFIGTVKLNHTLANILPPPGYNRHRPYVMAIQEHNGGVCLIQATSHEEVMEWIAACNYWAARLSKEPFPGGVSNIEYGWGSCLDDVILDLDAVESGKKIMGKYVNDPDAVSISQWVPPTPTMHSSSVDEETHYNNLRKYMSQLNDDMNENREIKKKILVKFPPKCQNHARVLSNWECKSKYMLHEIIKYQNYLDALENSINKQKEESL